MKKLLLLFCIIISLLAALSASSYEAEKCKLTGAKLLSEGSDFSGEGYVSFSQYVQNSIALDFSADKAGDYLILLKIKNESSEKRGGVKLLYDDAVYICSQKLPVTKGFETIYVNTAFSLTEGKHTLYIYGIGGAWQLDYISIEELNDENKKYVQTAALVTKNPSLEAQKVYDYLCSIEGKAIISGQQYDKGTEVRVIENTTGKSPALIGIDLMDYSPSRVAHGSSSRMVSEGKKWWNNGGLVTCCWHWNAPMDLIDEGPDKYWYSGFYTKATKYDFTKALKDQESEEYKTLIRDIDAIAKQLKSFQEDNIPILWRPLHEASGGWFWWGAKGADNYIELYKLLFDRLQNYHKLNNLIWVWNGQNPDWYPGDQYVDILSYDSYPGKNKHTRVQSELEKIQIATGQKKLTAISENGALPDIEELAAAKMPWTWFCTWNGDFVVKGRAYSEAYTSLEKFKSFYANDFLVTRDELPSFR